jgi:hypothetical protein
MKSKNGTDISNLLLFLCLIATFILGIILMIIGGDGAESGAILMVASFVILTYWKLLSARSDGK